MLPHKYLGFAGTLFFLLLAGCKKNPANTKSLLPSFKASFTIYEPFYGASNIYPTDTIVTYRATFAADASYDSYLWTVGDDPTIRTSKSFTLNFPSDISGKTLPAKLIGSKNGKSDTTVKYFTIYGVKGTYHENITPYCIKLPFLGRFEGNYEDAPAHKFVVTIINLDTSAGTFGDFRIINLPEGCGGKFVSGQTCVVNDISSTNYSYFFDYTYKAFYVHDGADISCCPPTSLFGLLDSLNPNKIVVDCYFKTNKRKFIGLRL